MSEEHSTLVTARLVLRPLRAEDADEMFAVLDDELLHVFTGGRPLSREELRLRYRRLVVGRSPDGSERWLNWIVRLNELSDVESIEEVDDDRAALAHDAEEGLPHVARHEEDLL